MVSPYILSKIEKILITGAAGFIGSHVAEALAKAGFEILGIDNYSTGRRENLEGTGIRVEECDITQEITVNGVFSTFQPQAVVHLAAQAAITTAQTNPQKDLKINGIGTLNITRACECFDVKQLVYASTSAVYGDRLTLAMPESTPLRPDNYYGASKLAGELYVHIADLVMKTILRFGNVYGPRQIPIGENQVIARMLNHLMYGEDFYIFGDGKQKRDFVYVEDVAQAVVKSIGQRGGAFNIAGGESHSVNEIARLVAKIYGLPGYDWEYDRKRMDERKNVRMKIERAELNLDWKPETDLESGLRKTVEWWKACQEEHSL